VAKSFANLIASEKLVGLAFKKGEGQWATISDYGRLNIPFQKCVESNIAECIAHILKKKINAKKIFKFPPVVLFNNINIFEIHIFRTG
jgi:6-phosphogluconate dehydrogenase